MSLSEKILNEKSASEKFNILAPITLDQNPSIYNKALDFAIDPLKTNIKNIGICGAYSAGKSTIWNTYIKIKNIKNIISISLAKYSKIALDINKDVVDNNLLENRIENQIINQIISQIDPKLIPLYSNKIKENKNKKQILRNFLFFVFFLIGIVGLVNINLFNNYLLVKNILIVVFNLFLIIPILWFSFHFIKNNKIQILEFDIKGIKGKLSEIDQKGETIFDKEIKEIIYLLYSSNVDYVVFDDLDRYKSIEVFEKLKQLNYLLNSYCKTKKQNKVVKFIYMVSDDLFDNEKRTKFFDFIITVIPIKTSKSFIKEKLKSIGIDYDDDYIDNLLSIITNVRIFLNAINDYVVYEKLALQSYSLTTKSSKKLNLFNIILFKNLLPDEFELLQNNTGTVFFLLDKGKEEYRKWTLNILQEKIAKIEEEIVYTSHKLSGEGYKHELIVRELTNVLSINDSKSSDVVDLGLSGEEIKNKPLETRDQTKINVLGRMYMDKKSKAIVQYFIGAITPMVKKHQFTYDEFFKIFIKNNKELVDKLKKLTSDEENKIKKLKMTKKDSVDNLYSCNDMSINELLRIIDWDNSDNKEAKKWFEDLKKHNLKNENNFSLIKSLFNFEMINEDYKEYINYII
ncbi:hypothetical protein MFERI15568_00288 [Mycoplasma feriruminatoris]|uniref:YobI-like P-loop NTPase domain-containing protein n=1 Tax=Mycoplasma feriruminatoris TaxID=1179777 RepID=A0AAQ3DN69_9MOLU|nr:hypothetical protein [Mycoplasma feriruminatoris]WFQ95045.1 hypothetical protein MFERI15407_00293 [Mycoplasma feriruminatoris]WFQ95864.1 hypothetical protein MFERI15568_00288 [Mycoplasma feriruminatoris]